MKSTATRLGPALHLFQQRTRLFIIRPDLHRTSRVDERLLGRAPLDIDRNKRHEHVTVVRVRDQRLLEYFERSPASPRSLFLAGTELFRGTRKAARNNGAASSCSVRPTGFEPVTFGSGGRILALTNVGDRQNVAYFCGITPGGASQRRPALSPLLSPRGNAALFLCPIGLFCAAQSLPAISLKPSGRCLGRDGRQEASERFRWALQQQTLTPR